MSNVDPGTAAQQAAEKHLASCQEALFSEDEVDDPSVGPYCGCDVCDIRETLAAAWPVLLAHAADMVAGAGHAEAAMLLRNEANRMALA